MGLTAVQQREQAHTMLDALPEDKLTAVRLLLEVMVEPFYTIENAPYDDEELSPQMRTILAERRAAMAAGKVTSHEDVLREFGL